MRFKSDSKTEARSDDIRGKTWKKKLCTGYFLQKQQ